MSRAIRLTLALLVLAAAAIAADRLLATGPQSKWKPDMSRGRQLAETLCANCHLIGIRTPDRVIAGVPSFRTIANRRNQTGERIANVLVKPHTPMPDMQLTRREIGDLIAYLDALRDAKSGPPLLKQRNKSGKKPTYPKPT